MCSFPARCSTRMIFSGSQSPQPVSSGSSNASAKHRSGLVFSSGNTVVQPAVRVAQTSAVALTGSRILWNQQPGTGADRAAIAATGRRADGGALPRNTRRETHLPRVRCGRGITSLIPTARQLSRPSSCTRVDVEVVRGQRETSRSAIAGNASHSQRYPTGGPAVGLDSVASWSPTSSCWTFT